MLFYSAAFPSGTFFTQLPIPLVGLFFATQECCLGVTQKVQKSNHNRTFASATCYLPFAHRRSHANHRRRQHQATANHQQSKHRAPQRARDTRPRTATDNHNRLRWRSSTIATTTTTTTSTAHTHAVRHRHNTAHSPQPTVRTAPLTTCRRRQPPQPASRITTAKSPLRPQRPARPAPAPRPLATTATTRTTATASRRAPATTREGDLNGPQRARARATCARACAPASCVHTAACPVAAWPAWAGHWRGFP